MNHAFARTAIALGLTALVLLVAMASAFSAPDWSPPVSVESTPGSSSQLNTAALEGCPMESPDGLNLYIASNRPGGLGGLDIYVARRANLNEPWGPPLNLGEPVNTGAEEFCPMPHQDGRLFFVSTRPGGCGGPDMYVAGRLGDVRNLGCLVNSAAADVTPSVFQEGSNTLLYFASNRPGGFAPEAGGAAADFDIYSSLLAQNGEFGVAQAVNSLNTSLDDARPNVRLDGLEVVFDSTRPGGQGGPDLWIASRKAANTAWSVPENPGSPINTSSAELRGTFSRAGDRLYFGSNRPSSEGDSDIYVSVRSGPGVQLTAPVTPPRAGDGGLADPRSAPVGQVDVLLAGAILAGAGVLLLSLQRARGRSPSLRGSDARRR